MFFEVFLKKRLAHNSIAKWIGPGQSPKPKTQAGIKDQVRYESLALRVEGYRHRQGGKSKRDQA